MSKQKWEFFKREAKEICNTKDANPRACILVRVEINYIFICKLTSRDLVEINTRIVMEGLLMRKGTLPWIRREHSEIADVVRYCSTADAKSDALAYNDVWASLKTNKHYM